MKPTMLLIIAFLLFAFTTYLPLAFSQGAEQVLDTNGKPIFPGGRYYILPAIRGPDGGGVWPGRTGNSECPVTVLQAYGTILRGKPVNFSIAAEESTGEIFTGTPLDIAFERKPHCAESSNWVLVAASHPHHNPKSWVGIGGDEDHPGNHLVNGTFNIQKSGDFGYKLVFCPTLTAPPGACFNIRRHDDENGRLLVLADEANHHPFHVVFVDAADANGLSSIV